MTINSFTIRKKSSNAFTVRVKDNSTLFGPSPVSIRIGGSATKSIEDIGDVDEISVAEGSTIVYNQTTNKYEIKKLDPDDLLGDFNLDCGEF